MTQDQSKTQSYPAPSARGSKAMAKPVVLDCGERSRGGAGRQRREEAGHRDRTGWRFGLGSGRVCVQVTKPVAPASWELPLVAGSVSHGAAVRVMRVIMFGQRHYHPTGEVPPCPARATDCHKWVTHHTQPWMKMILRMISRWHARDTLPRRAVRSWRGIEQMSSPRQRVLQSSPSAPSSTTSSAPGVCPARRVAQSSTSTVSLRSARSG